jgi:hypothetical protein
MSSRGESLLFSFSPFLSMSSGSMDSRLPHLKWMSWQQTNKPRRRHWEYVATFFVLTAILLGLIYALVVPPKTVQRPYKWHSDSVRHIWQQSNGSERAPPDAEILAALDVSPVFDYRRTCIDVRLDHGHERDSLETIPRSLLAPDVMVQINAQEPLPSCQTKLSIDVPHFNSNATVDTSALMLGVATQLSRVNISLDGWSRWLPHTRSLLLVLLVDHTDLIAIRDEVADLTAEANDMGIDLIFEPYKGNLKDTEGTKNFALAEALQRHRRPETKWFGVIDDDTFFPSLPAVLDALQPHDHNDEMYLGALTESFARIKKWGIMAWGGAGIFISAPLMERLARDRHMCSRLESRWGDKLWRDCIFAVTSPTVHLTPLAGLNQIDLRGDISGWYEGPRERLLSLHHWR